MTTSANEATTCMTGPVRQDWGKEQAAISSAEGPHQSEDLPCIDCGSVRVRAVSLRSPKDNNFVTPIDEPPFWTSDGYVILECGDCGSIFLHPHYFEESAAIYDTERYFTGYFPNNIHRGGGPELTVSSTSGRRGRRAVRRAERRARRLLRLAGISPESHPCVLEIGCAQGAACAGSGGHGLPGVWCRHKRNEHQPRVGEGIGGLLRPVRGPGLAGPSLRPDILYPDVRAYCGSGQGPAKGQREAETGWGAPDSRAK